MNHANKVYMKAWQTTAAASLRAAVRGQQCA